MPSQLAFVDVGFRTTAAAAATSYHERWNFSQDACFSGRGDSPWELFDGAAVVLLGQTGKRRLQLPAFASVGLEASRRRNQQCLREAFSTIDMGNKGFIDKLDLMAYAAAHGLPTDYVPAFMDAVSASSPAAVAPAPGPASRPLTFAGGSAGDDGSGGGMTSGDSSVGGSTAVCSGKAASAGAAAMAGGRRIEFSDFERFVASRERGLRDAFEQLDADRDGRLSFADLQEALVSVCIECPATSNVYRCKKECAAGMLSAVEARSQMPAASPQDAACDNSCTAAASAQQHQRQGEQEGYGGVVGVAAGIGSAVASATVSVDPAARQVTYPEFRHFFLLLPQRDMLVEYWASAACPDRCDVGGCVVLREGGRAAAPAKGSSPLGHLLAGAAAGAVSRTLTAPLETIRLQQMTGTLATVATTASSAAPAAGTAAAQAGGAGVFGTARGAVQSVMARGGGLQALWRGNLANVLKSAPQKALDFYIFEALQNARLAAVTAQQRSGVTVGRERAAAAAVGAATAAGAQAGEAQATELLQGKDRGSSSKAGGGDTVGTLAAAGLAGATSLTLLYPLEVVRSRVTCDVVGRYRGLGHALHTIVSTEGVPALYRGWGSSVAAILPEAAICYGLFDLLKGAYARATGRQEAGVVPSLAFGIVSAFMGQLVSYPLETVARRMQLMPTAAAGGGTAAGPVATARALVAMEGVRGLYRGLGAASLRTVPMALLSFGTYEIARRQLLILERRTAVAKACRQRRRRRRQRHPERRNMAAAATCAEQSGA